MFPWVPKHEWALKYHFVLHYIDFAMTLSFDSKYYMSLEFLIDFFFKLMIYCFLSLQNKFISQNFYSKVLNLKCFPVMINSDNFLV